LTWGLTAVGASLVFCVPSSLAAEKEGLVLDAALGFGGGKCMFSLLEWSS
jgi:hypothetical protein